MESAPHRNVVNGKSDRVRDAQRDSYLVVRQLRRAAARNRRWRLANEAIGRVATWAWCHATLFECQSVTSTERQ